MLRHISILTLREGVSDDVIARAIAECRRLPESVTGLVACAAGPAVRLDDGALSRELGISAGMGDMAIVLDFEDAEAWADYAAGPVRRRLVEETLGPIVAERRAIQFEV